MEDKISSPYRKDGYELYITQYDGITESSIQSNVIRYLKAKYPSVRYRTDPVLKSKASRSDYNVTSGWPDLSIYKAMGGWHGFFIELKRDKSKLFNADGSFLKTDRIKKQSERIQDLRASGYWADFACGFVEARFMIDWDMDLPFALLPIKPDRVNLK